MRDLNLRIIKICDSLDCSYCLDCHDFPDCLFFNRIDCSAYTDSDDCSDCPDCPDLADIPNCLISPLALTALIARIARIARIALFLLITQIS